MCRWGSQIAICGAAEGATHRQRDEYAIDIREWEWLKTCSGPMNIAGSLLDFMIFAEKDHYRKSAEARFNITVWKKKFPFISKKYYCDLKQIRRRRVAAFAWAWARRAKAGRWTHPPLLRPLSVRWSSLLGLMMRSIAADQNRWTWSRVRVRAGRPKPMQDDFLLWAYAAPVHRLKVRE